MAGDEVYEHDLVCVLHAPHYEEIIELPDHVAITRRAAEALWSTVQGDWTDDLQHAMNELDRVLEEPDEDE